MEPHALTPPLVLVADIGGTHITTALVELPSGRLLEDTLHRGHVRAQAGVNIILDDWAAVMQRSMQGADVQALGIAMPGPFDYETGISLIKGFHKYEALYGKNVKTLLMQRLDLQSIRMANDARCFLQGELLAGAVQGAQELMGFTLGTGFGSSVAAQGIAQEAHYYDFPFRGTRAEDYFCSRWLVQRYAVLEPNALIADVKTIAMRAADDGAARQLFSEFGGNLAEFFSLLEVPPALALLGGNITNSYFLFGPALEAALQQYGIPTQIKLASLGEAAPLYGAAALFLQGA
ncbi:ROK family protein [Chitinophaga parva]|uniref:ROK family protein n=1 Tax=Chitinophaga parva TaxID=2169414 RepID=UPI001401BC67|nr:ROK family protein [Chitinophaga parva]